MALNTRRWFDQSQPQTLQISVWLLYWNAAFGILFGALLSPLGLVFVAAAAASGLGIANEKKWGWWLGVGYSLLLVVPIVLKGDLGSLFHGSGIIGFMFDVALVVALLHPMSRSYKKIWFK